MRNEGTVDVMSTMYLNLEPEVEHTLEIFDDLRATQLAVAVETVDEGDGAFIDLVSQCLGTNHHFHLETVSLTLCACNDLLQNGLLVQTEATGQITNSGHQHNIGDQVGGTRSELSEKIPTVDTSLNIATVRITCTSNNVGVVLFLDANHFGDELGVVAEVGVHDNHKVTGCEFQTMNVSRSEAEFALARLQDNVLRAIELLELLANLEGAVRGAIVHDDNLPIQFAVNRELMSVFRLIQLSFFARTFR